RDLLAHHWLTALLPQRVTELFWVVVLGLLLCLPSLGVIGDVRSVLPVAAVFSAVAFRMGPYMSRISQSWQTVRFYLPALQLVGQLSVEPQEGGPRHGVRRFASIGREISFEDVNFSYGHGRFALSHVSVRFARGEVTAVIGPSGSGKSTLVDLLARLYDPTTGRIAVDGIDLAEYDAASWLATIGFVSQDTFIFHGTIRENIALARPGASAIQVQEAAMLANAHDFILRCPQGYETIVGDRGLKLSGGERQRIAIARALVRDPQVLIFDEATSALDNQSEALVQEAMASIARDRTVIIIAHRLSAVVGADKIVVLENGWVVEEGTHATLVKAGGVYSALYGKELT
ncbi:MAG: ATP-binding cassette domain-containing protein, partial [Nitrospirae bacterium]